MYAQIPTPMQMRTPDILHQAITNYAGLQAGIGQQIKNKLATPLAQARMKLLSQQGALAQARVPLTQAQTGLTQQKIPLTVSQTDLATQQAKLAAQKAYLEHRYPGYNTPGFVGDIARMKAQADQAKQRQEEAKRNVGAVVQQPRQIPTTAPYQGVPLISAAVVPPPATSSMADFAQAAQQSSSPFGMGNLAQKLHELANPPQPQQIMEAFRNAGMGGNKEAMKKTEDITNQIFGGIPKSSPVDRATTKANTQSIPFPEGGTAVDKEQWQTNRVRKIMKDTIQNYKHDHSPITVADLGYEKSPPAQQAFAKAYAARANSQMSYAQTIANVDYQSNKTMPLSSREQEIGQAAGFGIDAGLANKFFAAGGTMDDIYQQLGIPMSLGRIVYPLTTEMKTQTQRIGAANAAMNVLDPLMTKWKSNYATTLFGKSFKLMAQQLSGANPEQQAEAFAYRTLLPEQAMLRSKAQGTGKIGIEEIQLIINQSMTELSGIRGYVTPEVYKRTQELVKNAINNMFSAQIRSLQNPYAMENYARAAQTYAPTPTNQQQNFQTSFSNQQDANTYYNNLSGPQKIRYRAYLKSRRGG